MHIKLIYMLMFYTNLTYLKVIIQTRLGVKIMKNKCTALLLSGVLVASMMPFSVLPATAQNQNNVTNNNITENPTPFVADNAVLNWATKVGEGYDTDAIGSPVIVEDSLIFCSGTKLYKMNKYTGEIISSSDMAGRSSYNIVQPTYAEGMIFIGLSNGMVQAFNADTLQSLWVYNDELSGQPNSPIVYSHGYIYTGFWNSEDQNANYVCLSITDEDTSSPLEKKENEWHYTQKGGFYWAGAYANSNFVIVGTDDGNFGKNSQTSSLISFNSTTGQIIDRIDGLNGDIRSSICYDSDTNRYYFTSKGGSFYSVAVNENGTFAKSEAGKNGYDIKEIKLDNGTSSAATTSMSTSTPVVHNGRAYIGVSGSSQFSEYGGHNITVIDLQNFKIAYTVPTKGYPQASGLLTTAYESKDGYSYIYFVDNYTPGQIRVIKDKPGVTSVVDGVTEAYNSFGTNVKVENCAQVLFTPTGAQAQYALCTPVADSDGTLYLKNDSAYMMSIGNKIESIQVTEQPDKTVYGQGQYFDPAGLKVVANYVNGTQRDVTQYITYPDEALTTDYFDVTLTYEILMYGDKLDKNNGNQTGIEVIPPETYVDITVLPLSDYNTVNEVINKIHSIGNVTLESESIIIEAQEMYDSLAESLKQYITNYDVLQFAWNELTKLKSTEPTQVETQPETEPTQVETQPETEPTQVETQPETEPTQVETQPETEPTQVETQPQPTATSQVPSDVASSTYATQLTTQVGNTKSDTNSVTNSNANSLPENSTMQTETGKVNTGNECPVLVLMLVMFSSFVAAFVMRFIKRKHS